MGLDPQQMVDDAVKGCLRGCLAVFVAAAVVLAIGFVGFLIGRAGH